MSETSSRQFYDNTRLRDYKDCPRKYYLRHKRGWRKVGQSPALAFGLGWHAAQDVVWQRFREMPLVDLCNAAMTAFCDVWETEGFPLEMDIEQVEQFNPRLPGVAHQMLAHYLVERKPLMERAELLGVEQPFAVPIPRTGAATWYVGKLDKVLRVNEQTVVLEHKTTTEYKKDGGFRATYVEGWYMDSQVMGYNYGGSLYYSNLDQVWVDAALVHKTVHDKFRIIPVGHQWGMLEAWLEDTRSWISRLSTDSDLLDAGVELSQGLFPKNTGMCFGGYGWCQFIDICRTQHAPDELTEPPDGFIHEPWEPFDILGLSAILDKETGNGKQVEVK